MKNKKKELPLAVLQVLEPYLISPLDNAVLVDSDKHVLQFVDKDSTSTFHFIIEAHKVENNVLRLLVNFSPKDNNDVSEKRIWINGNQLQDIFATWLGILKNYDKVHTIFDDPLVKQYEEEFLSDFELVDEDAEYSSFDLPRQLYLDEYLDKVKGVLVENTNQENSEQIDEIKKNIDSLKSELTTSTKKETVKKLSKIWAKIRKIGIPIIKEIYVQVRNELIKQLIQGQIGN